MSGQIEPGDLSPRRKKARRKSQYKKPNTKCKFCKKTSQREAVTGLQPVPTKTKKAGDKLWHPVCEACIKSRKWEMTLETRNISLNFDKYSMDDFLSNGPRMVSG